ncbi:MAG: single-stranded DNA-binding protein [Bacteroidetes bacterium]|nr:single-stranded DNA-binding protein [Bacteroidota bacterium]
MINKVILLGRLGKDPQVKQLDNGRVVCNVTLATNDYYTDKDGNRKESTEWHNLEIWDNQARTAERFLKKGSIIYVEGKIRTDKYVDPEGQERQIKKIRVLNMQMMGAMARPEGENQRSYSPTSNQPVFENRSENADDNQNDDNVDDDLPF